ncbi:MAG: hypothetical protein IKE93_01195 [Erysipelotrichaceae bacterium]|nr:hypothetical protein [Erysipelotrichaceae bacterium]
MYKNRTINADLLIEDNVSLNILSFKNFIESRRKTIKEKLKDEMYKKEIDRFKKTIMSCWYEFENEEIGVEMAVFTEVINDKKNRTIT